MAIAAVGNRGSKAGTASLAGFATISPSVEVLAGDLLLMTVAVVGGVLPVSDVNDTQGNEWQVDVTVGSARIAICSSVLAFELTPADVITLQIGASLLYNLDLEEFSGIIAPSPKDVTATGSGSGTALTSGTTAATAQNSELAVAAWQIASAEASFTPGGADTAFGIVSQTGLGLFGQYAILSSTGTRAATGTAGTTGTWAGAQATYKGGADVGLTEQPGPAPFLTR